MEQVNVYSGDEVISRIFIENGLDTLESCLAAYTRIYVVMDSNVAMNCPAAAEIAQILNRRGVPGMLIDASEVSKNMSTVMNICGWLLDNGADRDALVLAVGGGITTDMVGFAASIYKRGVRFAYVPTTLLAQVDAGIGGKTGVNFENYKNMLGVIRQPEFVYICPQVLRSLPHRDFCSGAAEMLKTFIIEDGGNYSAAVKTLTSMQKEYAMVSDDDSVEYWSDCINAYSEELTSLISAAVRVKTGIVSRDQYEGGERRKLNLGHTFAHAIETLARRGSMNMGPDNEITAITHGEAVAIGLVLAARLSDRVFHGDMHTPTEQESRMRNDLLGCGINPDSPFEVGEMAEIMKKDKKVEGSKVHFVLIRETGDVVIRDLSVEEVIRLMA